MQTETALSTTEEEYIALSTGLRELIPILELLEEVGERGINVMFKLPTIHCKTVEHWKW